MRRAHLQVAAALFALSLAAAAAVFGAHEFVGEFGSTGQTMSCGSVWGLIETDNLNAATCQDDLRSRVTLVAALIGVAGMVALAVPALTFGRPTSWSRRRRIALAVGLTATSLVPIVMIAVGRHLIWSVSGA